jgi:hypothetical protein
VQLSEYQWSRNPRALHNTGAYVPVIRDRYLRLQLGWVKFVTGGEEFGEDCAWMLSNNMTPVIRIYRPAPGAMRMDNTLRQQWAVYASYGVKWFEFYNEPNFLDPEWPVELHPTVSIGNIDGVIRPLCENWLEFAEYIISLGGYPGFPAMGETVGVEGGLQWQDALLSYMRDNLRDRFMQVANNGLWGATHPYTLNHFYQSMPGQPATPRPISQYNAMEGGWHFEYPYDPLSQQLDPGRTVFGNTPSVPYGDPNGVIGMGTAFNQRMGEWFGISPLPIFGTEGGIYPLPIHESHQPDSRYPGYDRVAHAEATVAMFNWIATEAPEWMWGIALWKENEYYDNNLPALQRMEQLPAIGKGGQPLGASAAPVVLQGPGPINGVPTFHVIVLAPGLSPEWFFNTAQSYYNTYRPVVTTVWDFAQYIPYDRSLAITLISPPDVIESVRGVIQQRYPNVLVDVIAAIGDYNNVAGILNARVSDNRRFG